MFNHLDDETNVFGATGNNDAEGSRLSSDMMASVLITTCLCNEEFTHKLPVEGSLDENIHIYLQAMRWRYEGRILPIIKPRLFISRFDVA